MERPGYILIKKYAIEPPCNVVIETPPAQNIFFIASVPYYFFFSARHSFRLYEFPIKYVLSSLVWGGGSAPF